MVSLICFVPHTHATNLSKPSPKPECGTEPYFLKSKYHSKGFNGRSWCLIVSINMSMVLGLLPIVGSPLPIMSYGGSSLLATMIGFSIVLSAKINHNQNIS